MSAPHGRREVAGDSEQTRKRQNGRTVVGQASFRDLEPDGRPVLGVVDADPRAPGRVDQPQQGPTRRSTSERAFGVIESRLWRRR